MKVKNRMKRFLKDQSGDFGVKQIAITVAVIVVIGFIIGVVQGRIGDWVEQVWDMFLEKIQELTS